MSRMNPSELEGTVAEILGGAKYQVLLKNKRRVVAGLCNRTRFDRDRMEIGDKVVVKIRSREQDGACIVYRRNERTRMSGNTTWL